MDASTIIEKIKAGEIIYLQRSTKAYLYVTKILIDNGLPVIYDWIKRSVENVESPEFFDTVGDLKGFIQAEIDQAHQDKAEIKVTADSDVAFWNVMEVDILA